MSTKNFNKPFVIELQADKLTWSMVLIPHLFAIFVLAVISHIPIYVKVTLLSLVFFSLYFYLRKHAFKNLKCSVRKIKLDSMKNWSIFLNNNEQHRAELLPTSYMSNWLIILNFKSDAGCVQSAILTRFNIDPDCFRRLKIRLNSADL